MLSHLPFKRFDVTGRLFLNKTPLMGSQAITHLPYILIVSCLRLGLKLLTGLRERKSEVNPS